MSEGFVREKNGRWYYTIEAAKVNGKRNRIEKFGGFTEAEARKALRHALNEFENGGVATKLDDMSVADYFEYWLKNYAEKNLKYNTIKNYRNVVNNYIIPKLGNYHMKSVSPAAVQKFVNEISHETNSHTKKRLSKHSVEIIMTIIKEAFKRAVYPYEIIKDNPATYIDMPKYAPHAQTSRQDLKIITYDQYQQILADNPPASVFHMPLVIAFNTGMRRGEVLGLTWDHINLDDQTIEITQQMIQKGSGVFDLETPKSAASFRTITIGSDLVNELKLQRKRQSENRLAYGPLYQNNNFVCTYANGEPVLPGYIKYKSSKIQREMNFPFSFHSLRHTHATMLLEAGEKPKVVQQRLGHSRISTTMDTYMHVTRKMQNDTVSLFETYLKQQK
jgi:ATP-dependent helicase/nuclease subunit A